MNLVNEDIINNRDRYDIKVVDKNIDFMRVKIFFNNNALVLTMDILKIKELQGGDIVIFKKNIGIISDKINKNGCHL